MPQPVPGPERLEFRFDHYVLDGTPLEKDEWIVVDLPGGLGTKYGRYEGADPEQNNRPVLTVYRNREPKGRLIFPPEAARVRRSSEAEVIERSVEPRERGRDRVGTALEKVERAQNLLSDAAQELSPIPGFADEWTELCRVQGEVREAWFALERRRADIAAQTLRLGDDSSGPRYFLAGRPVQAGDLLEYLNDDGEWEQTRFEWTGLLDDPPTLHLAGGRVPVPESSEQRVVLFRWPER